MEGVVITYKLTIRYFVSLGSIVVLGYLYALFAVPLMEGSIKRDNNDDWSGIGLGKNRPDLPYDLEAILPAGSWEFDNCIRLETDRGLLFFKDFKTLEDGRLEVEPLTVILESEDEEQDEGAPPQPIVLTCKRGALLRFSEPIGLGQTNTASLEYARFRDQVKIFRHGSETTNDPLEITTQNVSIDRKRIVAPNDVTFRFGNHFGTGRKLTIDLLEDQGGPRRKSHLLPFGDLGELELVELDRLTIEVPRSSVPGEQASATSGLRPAPQPLVVTCAGSFRFNFQSLLATFERDVQVTQVGADGQTNRLQCERLEAEFESSVTEGSGDPIEGRTPPPTAIDRMKEIEIGQLRAVGHPSVLDLPSYAAWAQAQDMVYEPISGRVALADPHQVRMLQDDHQFEARELEYFLTEDGRLGNALARGPGNLIRLPGPDSPTFEASWQSELRIVPHEGLKAISLRGQPAIRFDTTNSFLAEEIHVWVKEIPKSPAAGQVSAGKKGKWEIVPVKLLAVNAPPDQHNPVQLADAGGANDRLQFDSPELYAQTNRLEVFFGDREPAPAHAASRSNHPLQGGPSRSANPVNPLPVIGQGNRLANGNGASDPADPAEPATPTAKLHAQGNLTRLYLTPVGKEYRIEELTLGGNVVLREIVTASPDEEPLYMTGEVLQATSRGADFYVMIIQGTEREHAHVSARGLTLRGQQINLDQLANQLWIEGPGNAEVRSKQPPPQFGRQQPEVFPTKLQWRDRLTFDGQLARAEGAIHANGTHMLQDFDRMNWESQCEVLEFTLDRRIDLSQSGSDDDRPTADVRLIAMKQDVVLYSQTVTPRGELTARDWMELPNLSIDQKTGEMNSVGAGQARSIRKGVGQELDQSFAANRSNQAGSANPNELTYVNVTFSAGLVGNIHHKEVHFVRDVDTIIGPVQNWGDLLERNQLVFDQTTSNSQMLCDRLIVAQWGADAEGKPMVELQGQGNAYVQGRGYEATAAKIVFNQLHKLLILEGDQQVYARLVNNLNGNGPARFAEARKIMYWRDEDRLEVDGANRASASFTGRLTPPRRMDNR